MLLVFMRQNTFEKKLAWGKLIIVEQIIQFELRGRGPSNSNSIIHLVVHVLLLLVIFMTKQ